MKQILSRKVDIYCDGACKGNPGPGGWGAYIQVEHDWKREKNSEKFEFELFGNSESNTTNNAMELTALVKAAEWLVLNHYDKDKVTFYIDSAYIINCYEQKWYKNWVKNGWLNAKKQPVANKELWEKIIIIFEQPNFHFIKVAGHKGIAGNEKADMLANLGVSATNIGESL